MPVMHAPRLSRGIAILACTGVLTAQDNQPPRELGTVRFSRDLDATLAAKPDKPVFLCFQEVPG
jgi:hypothetical protein